MGILDDISKAVSDTVKTVTSTISGVINGNGFDPGGFTPPPSAILDIPGLDTSSIKEAMYGFDFAALRESLATFDFTTLEILPALKPIIEPSPIIEPIIEPKPVVLETIIPWEEEIPETITEVISPWEEFEEIIPIIQETLVEEPSATRVIVEPSESRIFGIIPIIPDIIPIPTIPDTILTIPDIIPTIQDIIPDLSDVIPDLTGITDTIAETIGLPSKIAKYLLIGGGLIAGIALIYFLIKRRSPSIIDEVLGIIPEEAGVKGAKGRTKIKTKYGTFEQTGAARGVKVKMKK